MPFEHSPVKTRSITKFNSKSDKTQVQHALSDSSLSVADDGMQAAIQAAVEAAFSNDKIVGKFIDSVTTKVSESITENIKKSLQEALVKVDALQSEIVTLNKRLEQAEAGFLQRNDELEQYQRRNNLRVYGVVEEEGENTDSLLVDLFKAKLGVDVKLSDIDRSHRVGKIRGPEVNGTRKPRPIIVRFVSYRTRREIFQNKKKLKSCPVTVREDLTRHRQELLKKTIELHGARSVWTIDGRINWVSADNKRGRASWSI